MHQVSHSKSHAPWMMAACCGAMAIAFGVTVLARDTGTRRIQAPAVNPSGRSDASHVLDPARFRDPRPQQTYAIARQIPAVLNQLYCWCRCKENPRLRHRALLECFESDHASQCDICMTEAEIASRMVTRGVTDVRKIQREIDRWYEQLLRGT